MKEQLKIKESLLAIVMVGVLLYFLSHKLPILYIVFTIGILGMASKAFGRLVHKGFNWLTGIIAKINNTVLLSLIYWLVLTPVALVMRGSKKNGVILKKPSGSNFIERNHLFSKNDLNNPW